MYRVAHICNFSQDVFVFRATTNIATEAAIGTCVNQEHIHKYGSINVSIAICCTASTSLALHSLPIPHFHMSEQTFTYSNFWFLWNVLISSHRIKASQDFSILFHPVFYFCLIIILSRRWFPDIWHRTLVRWLRYRLKLFGNLPLHACCL